MNRNLVPADARQFTGANHAELRAWIDGGRYFGPQPQPGDWVIRVPAGYRRVEAAVFATTYRPPEAS